MSHKFGFELQEDRRKRLSHLAVPGRAGAFACLLLVAAGCSVGPNYNRPSAPAPPAFKEQPPDDSWKQAQPSDAFAKGRWWEIYNDPALNALEEQVAISNQNVLQSEAQCPH